METKLQENILFKQLQNFINWDRNIWPENLQNACAKIMDAKKKNIYIFITLNLLSGHAFLHIILKILKFTWKLPQIKLFVSLLKNTEE